MFNTNYNKTKIVATIGPASSTKEVLKELIIAGVDCFRINFSHGSYEQHAQSITYIRELVAELNYPIAILGDLQGPKLRIGIVEGEGIQLVEGEAITFVSEECIGTKEGLYMTYQNFPRDVKVGENILLDDGKLQLEIVATNRIDTVVTKVIVGGLLTSKKGVNLPNTKISLPSLTQKDLRDLDFAIQQDIDWIGLSFVRHEKDVQELRSLIAEKKGTQLIVAKIEKPEAIEHIDAIIAITDAVMVARGDLGVEVPLHQLPVTQKMIVKKCLLAAKPVIIATQMMESMITNPTPSRAEVNDVANSVVDGADAVMLSGETSMGKYPVRVIEYIEKIIGEVESKNYHYFRRADITQESSKDRFVSDLILYAGSLLARGSNATSIVGFTQTGYAAYKIASFRPNANLYFFTNNKKIINTLNIVWGVRGFYYDKSLSTDETIQEVKHFLKDENWVKKGDMMVHIASIPFIAKGNTNMVKLQEID